MLMVPPPPLFFFFFLPPTDTRESDRYCITHSTDNCLLPVDTVIGLNYDTTNAVTRMHTLQEASTNHVEMYPPPSAGQLNLMPILTECSSHALYGEH